MRFLSFAALALSLLITTPALTQEVSSRFFPPGTSLDDKIKEVLPKPEEEVYRQVAWRTNLSEARKEAQRLNKPLFVWAMHGNPLCAT